jgi:Relaxase/Mobilisation nuclease domain
MISKICTGHSFRGSILYICQDAKHAQIIFSQGVRDYNPKLMIQDFERQQGFRPEKYQACFHGILSFYPGENPGDGKIQAIAQKYLEGLNIRNTQVAIFKHTDKAHLHVHLVANMVDNDGKAISDRWIGLRGKKLAQNLTREYQLTQSISKDLSKIQFQSLKEPEKHKYLIYAAIKNQLRDSRTMNDLESRLQNLGIAMQYKYKGHSQEKQGVSFKLGEYAFKGSEIDRNFSYCKLEKTISLQQEQNLVQGRQYASSQRYSEHKSKTPLYENTNHEISESIASSIQKTLELLFKQEQEFEKIPYELSQAGERKKHHRQRLRHL